MTSNGRRHLPLRVALSPVPSAFVLALEALGGPSTGAPREWITRVRNALDRSDRLVLAPLVASRQSGIPDCLVPAPAAGATPSEDIERLVATEPEVLLEQIGSDATWAAAVRVPARWLAAYGRAIGHACAGLQPVWERAHGLLHSETERVGAAVVSAADRELVAALLRTDGLWRVRAPDMPRIGWLTAVPMLTGPHVTIARYQGSTLTDIAYPLPGASMPLEARPSRLDAVIGRPRARIITWLDRPRTTGEIAAMLQVVQSAVSWHVAALERGGLVDRERRGRRVLVRRTARGDALVALYADVSSLSEGAAAARF